MAEAVAGETGKPYVFVEPGAFTNMFFGVGVLKVRSLFKKLRKLALRYGGVIVFFDEADSLGSRGQLAGMPRGDPGGGRQRVLQRHDLSLRRDALGAALRRAHHGRRPPVSPPARASGASSCRQEWGAAVTRWPSRRCWPSCRG